MYVLILIKKMGWATVWVTFSQLIWSPCIQAFFFFYAAKHLEQLVTLRWARLFLHYYNSNTYIRHDASYAHMHVRNSNVKRFFPFCANLLAFDWRLPSMGNRGFWFVYFGFLAMEGSFYIRQGANFAPRSQLSLCSLGAKLPVGAKLAPSLL
jgi:hypothetical protein